MTTLALLAPRAPASLRSRSPRDERFFSTLLEALHTEDFVYQTKSGSAEPQSHSRIEELAGWRKLFSSGATMRIRFQRAEEYASTQVADGVWRISGLQMSSSVSYIGPNGQPTESTVSAPSVTFWVRMISADPKSFAIYRIESVL